MSDVRRTTPADLETSAPLVEGHLRFCGRALLRAVVEAAREAGAVAVSLATQHENERAQALYESEGFVADSAFTHYSKALEFRR
ncbi:GNAT family N-acetyltransferase [Arenivirga flava]|uniref:N-acetyltransferase domain-containing protein n=1 Tax=Arenivirga flava TaxID=1930060 RepID=A0AA37XA27_9MICO|nr:GNAT family N-acetyltransferase [Arenivirga flava]GMA27388.1 hypothetical protein GCM10025874_06410 [Arenivirga flava]